MTIYASLSRPRHSGERPNPEDSPACVLDSGVVVTPERWNPGRNDDYRVRSNDIPIQVSPLTVCGLDQIKLPSPTPALDCLLARDGRLHRLVRLEPDQHMNPVLLGESFDEIALVLPDTLNQIGRHADIQSAVSLAGKEIDARLFHVGSVLDSGVRRNDESGGGRQAPRCFSSIRSQVPRHSGGGRNSLPRTRSSDEPTQSVIPGLTRNPVRSSDDITANQTESLDSGVCRNDGRGRQP